MKVVINGATISDDLNEVLVTTAIRALKDGDTCRLERHDSFMDALRNTQSEFWLQYQDADTGMLLEHDPLSVPQNVVIDAFNSFFLQNGIWKSSNKWKVAEQQPNYQAALTNAAGENPRNVETTASPPASVRSTARKVRKKVYSGPLSFHRQGHTEERPSESHVMATLYNLGDTESWIEVHRPGWMLRASCTDGGYQMICRDMNKDKEYRFGPIGLSKNEILRNFLAFRCQQDWSASSLTLSDVHVNRAAEHDNNQTSGKTSYRHASSPMETPSPPLASVWDTLAFGPENPNMICQHCQAKGGVHTKRSNKKVGISGGKATAGLLTGGLSLLVLGLSRKETVTEAHCRNCNATWHY